MNKVMIIVACAAMALAGCATRKTAVVEERTGPFLRPGITHLKATHAHLRSILGVDDLVLADTNKFVLGDCNYSQEFKLDKPFDGFAKARIYLDRMGYPGLHTTDGKPHRLRSVELRRQLPDDATDKDLIAELQDTCDLVAEMLDVEPPKVRLVDVEKWRKAPEIVRRDGPICTCVTFDLADNQDIEIQLTEPVYAMRDGKMGVACPGYVEIDLTYNRNLCLGGVGRRKAGDEDKAEIEIDFGPDCRDKLAKALKDGIEQRTKRAKRKPRKEDGDKAK